MPVTVCGDIMTKPVDSIPMDLSLREIRHTFESERYHHLVVHNEAHECVGVVSDRDLLKNISPFVGKMAERSSDLSTLDRRAHQIMTRQLVAARPRTTVRDAARIMLDHQISCLPVLNDANKCVGILTLRDIVRWAADEIRIAQQAA